VAGCPWACTTSTTGPTAATSGHLTLEPGDWLALHTDGVTEARSAHGTLFGEARLADHLERAAADDQPPPETVRRLLSSVLAHQDGVLQDDATVLLARWRTEAAAPRSRPAAPGQGAGAGAEPPGP
jgi:serine/threonine protein phosphatase PrpC